MKMLTAISVIVMMLFQNFCAATDREELKSILNFEFQNNVKIIKTPRGIVASFPQDVIFCPDSIVLSKNGKVILNRIGKILKKVNNKSTVEGHSDSFGKLEPFEASIVKADIVSEYLIKRFPELNEKIFSLGLGNFDPQNRLLKDEKLETARIDIVFFSYDITR